MKKNSKSPKPANETKSLFYSLRKRPISTNSKNNIEKMLAQMKKQIINEISKVAEDIFNEHKSKIINAYNESQINESIPVFEIKENKKALKSKKSKNHIDNSSLEKVDNIQYEKIETQIGNNNIVRIPNNTKSKKALISNKKSKSHKQKNFTVSIEGDKTETSLFNEIAKINEIAPKNIQKEKNENKEPINETIIIGKKTKRGKVCYSLIVSPENKNEIVEKKPKKSIKKKSYSTTKKNGD